MDSLASILGILIAAYSVYLILVAWNAKSQSAKASRDHGCKSIPKVSSSSPITSSTVAHRDHYLDYPFDIMVLILPLCDETSIYNLFKTHCPKLRTLTIPFLYRTVDLSSHNAGRIPAQEDNLHPEMWACYSDDIRPPNHVWRQRSFLRDLTKYPVWAAPMRTFSWTLIWGETEEYELTEAERQLWAIFGRLDQVTKLDITALTPDDKVWERWEPYTVQAPPVLFPSVTDLRLVGWLPKQLVTSIFNSINLSSLRTLSLDALQERGNFSDGSPICAEVNRKAWSAEWRARLNGLLNPPITFLGPMYRPILPLINQLSSLQHLEIRIPPLEECGQHRGLEEPTNYRPEYLTFFSVLRHLVVSVQPTLDHLIIDYTRIPRTNPGGKGQIRRRVVQDDRLHRAAKILGSIFASPGDHNLKRGSKVTFKGFLDNHDRNHHGRAIGEVEDVRDALQTEFLSRGIQFEWQDDSPRPAHLYMGHLNGCDKATLDSMWETLINDHGVQREDTEEW